MQPKSRIFLATLIAVTWSGLASAQSPSTEPETDELNSVIELNLDVALEESAHVDHRTAMLALTGPTSMSCTHPALRNSLETCVVTTPSNRQAAMPAALAQH